MAEAKLITDEARRKRILAYLGTLEEGQGPGGLGASPSRSWLEMPSALLANPVLATRHQMLFDQARKAGFRTIAVVGDEWVAVPFFLQDIGDNLQSEFAVLSRAAMGNCVLNQSIVDPAAFFTGDYNVEAVLVSAGLCELFSENGVVDALELGSKYVSPIGQNAELQLFDLAQRLSILVDSLIDQQANAQIYLHGYDYLQLRSEEGQVSTALMRRGYTGEHAFSAVMAIIDSFNSIVSQVAAERPRVFYINLRDTLSPSDWYREIIANNDSFAKIALIIKAALLNGIES